ncbi:sigma 54-interacting transcriptional regulator [Candidatus Sumerlaeota bacterium]
MVMLNRIVFAIDDKTLQRYLEQSFEQEDVWIESYGSARSSWQKVMRSGGDIIVVSESLMPDPIEVGVAMLNDLPENPTTVVLVNDANSERQAQLVAVGADVVLYAGIAKKSMAEAIEGVLQSRQQYSEISRAPYGRDRIKPKIDDFLSESEVMKLFVKEIHPIIASNSPLLLLGETGVGKEHLARAIHARLAGL